MGYPRNKYSSGISEQVTEIGDQSKDLKDEHLTNSLSKAQKHADPVVVDYEGKGRELSTKLDSATDDDKKLATFRQTNR